MPRSCWLHGANIQRSVDGNRAQGRIEGIDDRPDAGGGFRAHSPAALAQYRAGAHRQLLRRFGHAGAALEALPDLARRGGGGYRIAPEDRVARGVPAVAPCARYLFHDAADYPPLLAELDSAPPILTVRGDAALAQRPCVAIVGARNASAAAVKLARQFAGDLAEAGFTVGFGPGAGDRRGRPPRRAAGRDHRRDRQRDRRHLSARTRRLAGAGGGAGLAGPYSCLGTEPLARHFPSRNWIIACLAAGRPPRRWEAAPRSGLLITARLAAEAGARGDGDFRLAAGIALAGGATS